MDSGNPAWCPSSRPTLGEAVAFGVVHTTENGSMTSYLEHAIPAEQVSVEFDRLHAHESVAITEVIRFASPCASAKCRHFHAGGCSLVERVIENLDAVVDKLPSCRIRGRCLWWHQEGKSACFRCPQIRTDSRSASEVVQRTANVPRVRSEFVGREPCPNK